MRLVRMVQLLVVAAVAVMGLSFASVASAAPDPCADLQITNMSTSPTEPVQGLPSTVSVTVKNAGSCAADGFVVQWKSDRYAPTGPSQSVDGLAAGASTTVTFTYSFPNDGNFLTMAQVDTGNAVPETNEENNLEISPVTVQPQKIDLQVTNISYDPTPPVATWITTVSVTVTNEGNAPAGKFRLDWSPGLFIAGLSRQVGGLDPGDSTTITFTYTWQKDGKYNSSATVDATGMVAETNELNNTLYKDVVVDPPLPNLTVDNIRVNPYDNECRECEYKVKTPVNGIEVDQQPIAGTESTIEVTVVNNGHTPSGSFIVEYTPQWFAKPLREQVDSLDVGETRTVTFNYTFPSAGHVNGTVKVDSTRVVKEVHEDDNDFDLPLDVQAATRDLVVDGLYVDPSTPIQGDEATFTAVVTNYGNSPSGPFVLEINPDTFGIITPSAKTISRQVNDLGPGQTAYLHLTFTYPKKGNFRVVAKADAFNSVKETNEANNLKILNVTVAPAPIDLVITNFTISPSSPVRGKEATASITVKNNGPIDTGGFFTTWKPTDKSALPPTQFYKGLHPGESTTLTFKSTYWSKGSFTSVAQVDTYNQVVEPNGGENNNTVSKAITVVPPSATLDVKLDHLIALNDMDDSLGNNEGEWNPIVYAVFDPSATCHLDISRGPLHFKQDIKMVACKTTSDDSVQDDDKDKKVVNTNLTIRVTLEDFTPVAAAVGVLEDDDPLAPDVPGFATFVKFPPDYLNVSGLQQVAGQKCLKISATGSTSEASGGHCFDAYFGVGVVSSTGQNVAQQNVAQPAVAQSTDAGDQAASQLVSLAAQKLAVQRTSYLNKALNKLRAKYTSALRKSKKAKSKKVRKAKMHVRAKTSHKR